MQGHDGPLTRLAGQVQFTAVAFNQGFGKRQPKTSAAVVRRPGIVNLAKWRQRGDDVFRLDADSGVLYLDPQARFRNDPRRYADLPASRCEFGRIRYQIEQNLTHAPFVAAQRRQIFGDTHGKLDLTRFQPPFQKV